jgi:hypothetical protein
VELTNCNLEVHRQQFNIVYQPTSPRIKLAFRTRDYSTIVTIRTAMKLNNKKKFLEMVSFLAAVYSYDVNL